MFHGEDYPLRGTFLESGGRMEELRLVSPIPPSVNHYMAIRMIRKKGRPTAMTYKTNEAKRYQRSFKEYVIKEVEAQCPDHTPDRWQHFYVDAIFYFDRIDMDANNYWKVLLDAITDTKKVWVDDNVVCERVRRVLYDTANPRVELTIRPVDYIGIFDDVHQLEQFESNCLDCVRYSRNCSILQKAKEGRIQEDIVDCQCTKYTRRKGKKKGK